MRFRQIDNHLMIEYHRQWITRLEPIKPDVFSGRWPIDEFNVERDKDGTVAGFSVQRVHLESLK